MLPLLAEQVSPKPSGLERQPCSLLMSPRVGSVGWLVLKLPLPRIAPAAAVVWQVIWGGVGVSGGPIDTCGSLPGHVTCSRSKQAPGPSSESLWEMATPPGGVTHWGATNTVNYLPSFLPSGRVPRFTSINRMTLMSL